MSFTYNTAVPASNDNPSDDQPDMLVNTQSINSILNVDHVTFNDALGGTHKQVTFSSKNAGAAQTDPSSVLYTGNGQASSVAQLFYKNQSATLLLSGIRAWGIINSSGNIVNSQSFNVSSATLNSTGYFTVTLTANATASTSYGVIVTASSQAGINPIGGSYNITGITTFELRFRSVASGSAVTPDFFNFIVIQL